MTAMDKRISEIGVVPVIKLNNPERDAAPLAKALCEGGVPVAEVTFRAPRAEVAIKAMREACPNMLVGAGTVLTKEQVDLSIEAGAQFIVLPGFDPELVSVYYGEDVSEDQAQVLADVLQDMMPDAEVAVIPGGQPVYYYIISAE